MNFKNTLVFRTPVRNQIYKARLDLTSTFVLRVVIGKRCTGNLEYMDDVIRFFRCRFVQLAAQ